MEQPGRSCSGVLCMAFTLVVENRSKNVLDRIETGFTS